MEESALSLTLTGAGFRYTFDKRRGLFSSLVWENRNFLTRPMEWNVYRAPHGQRPVCQAPVA